MNVYDFDKTIFYKDCTVGFYFFNLRKNPLILRYFPKQAFGYFLYFLHIIDITKAKSYFYTYLKGVKNIDEKIAEYWEKNMPLINEFYLNNHQDNDVVISASAYFMVKPVCDKLHISHLIASEVDKYSGLVCGKNCSKDQKVIRLQEYGYNISDVDDFYSDSYNDQPLADIAKRAFMVKNGRVSKWVNKK